MWSRVRHRRLQALSLALLAALLTTSFCLGPLYQRAMEQALAGSVLAGASPEQKSIQLIASDRTPEELAGTLPDSIKAYLTKPSQSLSQPLQVTFPDSSTVLANRLYAVDDACVRLEITEGACPAKPGEVMVSTADVKVNGWTVGSTVDFVERLPQDSDDKPGDGKLTIVGVYAPPDDPSWLGAPITGRAGSVLQGEGSASTNATDDWVTDPSTFTTVKPKPPTHWHAVQSSVVWSLDPDLVDHDSMLRLGPLVEQLQSETRDNPGSPILLATDIPNLSDQIATGSEQGRTTVVVLVVQLLVLVAVVLWMVLVAATDDRRPELALARLRGRGRRGAAAYLLAELLPVTLIGVAVGILAAPLVMAVVGRLVFPVPVPVELPNGFLLAALGSAVAVLGVVLAAARRAVREPIDSLLRAVQARHSAGTGAAEIAMIVFSLTAVVALVTGNLEGPLSTLAPTLLAVATGLLLGRALAPATRLVSRWLLRRGRAVDAAGIVNAVRRPAARRVLVMVLVASALLVFCVDALVTGQHNRQNAAEQANGAPYSLTIQSSDFEDVVAALDAADPHHEHLSPVVTTDSTGGSQAPTVAVDTTAFPRIAYFPLSRSDAADWPAIAPPDVDPLRLTGSTVTGTLAATKVLLTGPSESRADQLTFGLQLLEPDGTTNFKELSVLPRGDASVSFSTDLPCTPGCTVTGVAVHTPPGGEVEGTVVVKDVAVDGQPFSLGASTGWRGASGSGGSLDPGSDPDGNLAVIMSTTGSTPPVMVNTWVPQPVPALVSSSHKEQFSGAGLDGVVDLSVAGRIVRVPGAPPDSVVVSLEGLLRRANSPTVNAALAVWSDDAASLARAKTELKKRGVTLVDETTVDQVRSSLDASPAAWSLALSVLVGGAAVLIAMLVMIVATATTWRARATDLAALRMAGLPSGSLRRMELLGQLPVVVVGAVAGSACGIVAAVVALPGVRQFTQKPEVDTTDFATPWAVVLGAAVVALLLLSAVAVAASRWTARRARLNRVREVV